MMPKKVKVPSDTPSPDTTERKRVEEALWESEEKYRSLVNNVKLGIFRSTPEPTGRFLEVNPAMEEITGYSREELLQMNVSDLYVHPEERRAVLEVIASTIGKTTRELRFRKKDETEIVVSDTKVAVRDDTGKVLYFDGIVEDITERKQAEEALRESHKRFRDIAENALEWIWEVNANGKYTYAGPVVEKILGYKPEELLKEHFYDLFHPDDREELKKAAFEVFAKKQSFREFVNRNMHKNGKPVWLLTSGVPILDEKGDLIGYRGADTDITERKRAEEELRSSEERLRILFEYAPDAYYLNDLKGNFIDGNKAAEEIIGYKRDELIGKSFLKLKLLSPRQIPKSAALLAKNVLGQATGPEEFILNRKDGTQIPVEIRTFPVKIEGKTLVLGIARDITERKQAEAKLRESDERYGAIFESTSDMLVLIDRKGKILDVNENIAQISEYEREEIVGKNIRSLTKIMTKKSLAIIAKNFLKRMAGMNIPPYEIQMIKKNGELRSVEINAVALRKDGRIVGDLAIIKDITERKRMEQEIKYKNEQLEIQNEELIDAQENLVRSERLAAIGQLAGGVGHELRNPLGAIKNAIYYVRGKVIKSELGNKEPRVMEFLDIIDEEINSSNKIINDLLGFSRVGKPVVSPTRIEKVIEDALSYTTIPENIELTKKLGTDLPEVKIDTDQVRQVLVNMIINAAQAMPTGGKLTISAGEKDKFLEVEIADTGCGIPQEVMDKIFGPLFTTRAKGIGLGLAVCKAIIDRHQGYIEVDSEVGKGTTFTIKLPLEAE